MDIHYFLNRLSENSVVLDLGCGQGSFHYQVCGSRIVAMDVALPENRRHAENPRVDYLRGDSSVIPLADSSIDVVFSHHTMEHFPDYKAALGEIARILKPSGWLWIAIPNGYGLDDGLYRAVFSGGGHVNRFTFDGLVNDVRQIAGLNLVQACDLFSSFGYLKKPSLDDLQHFPRTARVLAELPDGFSIFGILALNTVTRLVDKMFGSRYSQYGWGFVFAREAMEMERLPSYFSVCRQCGSGIPAESIETPPRRTFFGLRLYNCPNCAEVNVFVRPPNGLQ